MVGYLWMCDKCYFCHSSNWSTSDDFVKAKYWVQFLNEGVFFNRFVLIPIYGSVRIEIWSFIKPGPLYYKVNTVESCYIDDQGNRVNYH